MKLKIRIVTTLTLVVIGLLVAGTTVQAQKMPRPKLKLVSVTDGTSTAGPTKVYEVSVENHAEYDDDLFIATSVLPPCGKTTNASRTWVNIYNEVDLRLYGHCVIKTNSELASLKFILPANKPQPKEIFIDFVDRFEGVISRSKNVKIP